MATAGTLQPHCFPSEGRMATSKESLLHAEYIKSRRCRNLPNSACPRAIYSIFCTSHKTLKAAKVRAFPWDQAACSRFLHRPVFSAQLNKVTHAVSSGQRGQALGIRNTDFVTRKKKTISWHPLANGIQDRKRRKTKHKCNFSQTQQPWE